MIVIDSHVKTTKPFWRRQSNLMGEIFIIAGFLIVDVDPKNSAMKNNAAIAKIPNCQFQLKHFSFDYKSLVNRYEFESWISFSKRM